MNTHTQIKAPTPDVLLEAAALIRAGKLVAFPTETVYGLGGDATNDNAVAAIYAAKGRPQFNPLIVHVTSRDEARTLVRWCDRAEKLAATFWPGPLTFVLPRQENSPIALLASAGLDTIAIRCPAHPVALELIRAAADVRNLFSKNGGNLGATGSVSYMFKRLGQIEYDASVVNEDEVMEVALEAGADDVSNEDGVITVTTDPMNFEKALEALQAKGWESLSAAISMVPDTYSTLDNDTTRKVLKLIEKLEENDDVQNVYSNLDIPEGFEE